MNVGTINSRGVMAEITPKTVPGEMARQDPALRLQNQAIAGQTIAGEEEKSSARGPSAEDVKKMVEEMQTQLDNNANLSLKLKYTPYGELAGNKLSRIAVSVVDKLTGDVIREIPTKEIQTLHTKMSELAGIIFSREA